ncbi:MAG: hypothetical protein ACO1N9_09550 [Flavobacterium sp.]
MNSGVFTILTKSLLVGVFCLLSAKIAAQDNRDFWERTRFGGSLAVAFGSGYTDVTLAPGFLYEVNEFVGLGAGVQGTYVQQRNYFSAFMYGGSVITVVNPLPQIQLSAELEQLRVNLDVDESQGDFDRNFWNTALFFGVGYRSQNVTIGLRYNVLFDENELVYNDALMPFVRVYF